MQTINIFALFPSSHPKLQTWASYTKLWRFTLEQRDYLISSDKTDISYHSVLPLPPCSITLHMQRQMRCQEKWIEMCFIALQSLSASDYNCLTKSHLSLEVLLELFFKSAPIRWWAWWYDHIWCTSWSSINHLIFLFNMMSRGFLGALLFFLFQLA